MPTPHVTPPSNGTASTWQIGTYNAVTDAWTLVLDLNDRSTWFVKTYDLAQPEKVVSRSGNPRTQGERITNERYKNRYITLTLQLRSTTTLAAIDTAIHSLESALSNTPFMLRLAEAQAAQYSYAVVKSWIHNIPQDPLQRLALVKTSITLVLECEPFLLGDKLYLDNLVVNPGFEAPSGPGVQVFNDTFANVNAYSVLQAPAPTLAANVMTLGNGTIVSFGSPVWGAVNQWAVRWQWQTGLAGDFWLHYTDFNNNLGMLFTGTSIQLNHKIAGTVHTLASNTPTLVNGNFYWTVLTQFPTVPGDNPSVQATLYNDSAGAIGTAVTNGAIGPVATFDAVTAVTGRAAIFASGATMAVGGAFTNVHTVGLFGPGGWIFTGINSTTGTCSGAWEQNTANTYPSGPVTSYGAGRIDLPPAGTVSTYWESYSGGAPAGTTAIPTTTGQVMAASAVVKSSGLSVSAIVLFQVREWNASGAFLRSTTLQSLTGNQSTWTQLSGTVTMGASTAYCSTLLLTSDTTTGSANGTVWFDNVQVWNQTTTGQTTMPYCELRFPQAPAQLMVSGLVGDVATPASLAFGTYVGNSIGTPWNFLIGRRSYATSGAQLVAAISDTSNFSGSVYFPVLDSPSYGGYYIKWTPASSSAVYTPNVFNGKPADYQGNWALCLLMQSSETNANIGKVTAAAVAATQSNAWVHAWSNNPGLIYDTYMTASAGGLTTQNTWSIVTAGVVPLPSFARSASTDLTQNYQVVGAYIQDSNTTPVVMHINWCALIPNDGQLVRGQIQYQGSMSTATINSWNWYYIEGSQSNSGIVPVTGYSTEATAIANIGHAAGGAGVPPSAAPGGAVSVIPTGNAYLTLDPTPPTNVLSVNGVNELTAVLSDPSGAVVNFVASLSYTPRYLDPR